MVSKVIREEFRRLPILNGPTTYAEVSKSGQGITFTLYLGKVEMLIIKKNI